MRPMLTSLLISQQERSGVEIDFPAVPSVFVRRFCIRSLSDGGRTNSSRIANVPAWDRFHGRTGSAVCEPSLRRRESTAPDDSSAGLSLAAAGSMAGLPTSAITHDPNPPGARTSQSAAVASWKNTGQPRPSLNGPADRGGRPAYVSNSARRLKHPGTRRHPPRIERDKLYESMPYTLVVRRCS